MEVFHLQHKYIHYETKNTFKTNDKPNDHKSVFLTMKTLQRMCLSTDIGIPNPGFDYNQPQFVIPAKSAKMFVTAVYVSVSL